MQTRVVPTLLAAALAIALPPAMPLASANSLSADATSNCVTLSTTYEVVDRELIATTGCIDFIAVDGGDIVKVAERRDLVEIYDNIPSQVLTLINTADIDQNGFEDALISASVGEGSADTISFFIVVFNMGHSIFRLKSADVESVPRTISTLSVSLGSRAGRTVIRAVSDLQVVEWSAENGVLTKSFDEARSKPIVLATASDDHSFEAQNVLQFNLNSDPEPEFIVCKNVGYRDIRECVVRTKTLIVPIIADSSFCISISVVESETGGWKNILCDTDRLFYFDPVGRVYRQVSPAVK